MAVGTAAGDDWARVAAEQAISSEPLDITIDAAGFCSMSEVGLTSPCSRSTRPAARPIKEAHPDAGLIFGAIYLKPGAGDRSSDGFERTGAPHGGSWSDPGEQNSNLPAGDPPDG